MRNKKILTSILLLLVMPIVSVTQDISAPHETSEITTVVEPTLNIQTENFQPQEKEGKVEDSQLQKVGGVLLMFLVLSIIFEVALTPIFNWRVFLARFDKKGIKTPLTVILGLIVFWTYDLDILRDVLCALGNEASLSFGGQFVTALLIAGGSDGIFRIFTKLGLRDPVARDKKAQEARAELIGKNKP